MGPKNYEYFMDILGDDCFVSFWILVSGSWILVFGF